MKTGNTEKQKTVWLPDSWEVVIERNPNYLHSLSIGLLAPLFNLPMMILRLIVIPFLKSVLFIVLYVTRSAYLGIAGNLSVIPQGEPRVAVKVIPGKRRY